jgi:hypothetical protein
MSAVELVRTLEQQGVQLWIEDERLRFRAPRGVLTDKLRQAIERERADLIALLADTAPSTEGTKGTNADVRVAATDFSAFSSFSQQVANDDDTAAAAAMARWRVALSKRLQHWDDEHLQALAVWNIVVAFDRAGATGFRRHLAPSLAVLSDDDIAALVDWPTLATLEQRLWQTNPETAAPVSRGAQKLATWWNARRNRSPKTDTDIRQRSRTPKADGRRLDGL